MNKLSLLLSSSFFFLMVGCEQTFQPIDNTAGAFSMYGVLDVHADTQWIRVMPIGETLLPSDPTDQGVEVRLTREATGETVILEDSLFRFSNDTYVRNYMLADSVHANELYTLVAENQAGEISTAVVETPSPLQVPTKSESGGQITIRGVLTDSLVVTEVNYLVQAFTPRGCAEETGISVSQMNNTYIYQDSTYSFAIQGGEAIFEEIGTRNYRINKQTAEVITATSSWPNVSVLDDIEISLPDVVSNVENGTGVVAGIARRILILVPRMAPC